MKPQSTTTSLLRECNRTMNVPTMGCQTDVNLQIRHLRCPILTFLSLNCLDDDKCLLPGSERENCPLQKPFCAHFATLIGTCIFLRFDEYIFLQIYSQKMHSEKKIYLQKTPMSTDTHFLHT